MSKVQKIEKELRITYESYLEILGELRNAKDYDKAIQLSDKLKSNFMSISALLKQIKEVDEQSFVKNRDIFIPKIASWRRIADENLIRVNPNYDRDRGEDN